MKNEKEIKQRIKDVNLCLGLHKFVLVDEKSTNEEKKVALEFIKFYETEIDILNWILR